MFAVCRMLSVPTPATARTDIRCAVEICIQSDCANCNYTRSVTFQTCVNLKAVGTTIHSRDLVISIYTVTRLENLSSRLALSAHFSTAANV